MLLEIENQLFYNTYKVSYFKKNDKKKQEPKLQVEETEKYSIETRKTTAENFIL